VKVYVAGASKEPERVRRAMNAVLAEGWELTHDWLAEIERVGSANDGLTLAQRCDSATRDLRAIREADMVWLLAPENDSTGAWVELGYVLGLYDGCFVSTPGIVVSGPGSGRSIFCALTECVSDDTALSLLREGAR
jgi:hypothetical protein